MPGDLPGASREPVGTIFETRRRFSKILRHSGHVPEPIRGPSRVQLGPQNRQKTDLWPKKWPRGASPGAFFTDLLCRHRFRSIFCRKNVDFQRILDTFCDSKKMNQESSIPFLQRQRTLKICVFSR